MKKLILLIGLLFVLLSFMAYATVTCTTEKADSGNAVGTTMFNATLLGVAGGNYNATGAVLYLKCTNTANSSYVLLANDSSGIGWSNVSDSSNGAELNITTDTTGMEDSLYCYAYIEVSNHTQGTNEIVCSASSVFTIDNTKPATPSLTYDDDSLGDTGTSIASDITLEANDIIYASIASGNVTSCLIYFDNDYYSMTEGSTSATKTIGFDSPPDDVYGQVYVTCTDGLNSSTSSKYSIEVNAIADGDGASVAGKVAKETTKNKFSFLYLILIAGGFWFFFLREK